MTRHARQLDAVLAALADGDPDLADAVASLSPEELDDLLAELSDGEPADEPADES